MLINNKFKQWKRQVSNRVSIIDLVLLIVELSFLILWEILEDYPSLLNHKWILLYYKDLNYELQNKDLTMTTSRNIQGLTKSLEDLELAFID